VHGNWNIRGNGKYGEISLLNLRKNFFMAVAKEQIRQII
jgi:hypothetical protein